MARDLVETEPAPAASFPPPGRFSERVVVPIHCPYCRNALGLKATKPGRYSTKCPKCAKRLLLVVPADPSEPPSVTGNDPGQDETIVAETPAPASAVAETRVAPSSVEAPGDATQVHSAAPPTAFGPTLPSAAGATAAWTPASDPAETKPSAGAGATDPGFEVASPPDEAAEGGAAAVPGMLGGYQVVKELGRGGMGAVYLARQISLDRDVALKVMKPEWARNPTFVSRFTREAYAAAQLAHHNVVQIYDFGQDRGTCYFSMEYVRGRTLSALVREQKRLDPEVAVGYVLQAARGLKYAHDQSMIHRDVKPENLLLNDQGVVKVADLGLVKTPAMAQAEEARESQTAVVASPAGSIALAGQITQADIAMGTPAFMAPEQARDAAGVDARADIYSLGCTLYDLVTGRPPFEGKTVVELITKHQTEPVVPPEAIVKHVPRGLSQIILKMVAKKPEDRYANLGEVIRALEGFLGIHSTAPFSPREEHADLLVESVQAFHASPTARRRPRLMVAGFALCAAVVVLAALARQPFLATGFLGLGLMTALAYFVIDGVTRKTHLFLKARGLVFGASPGEWLLALAGLVLLATALVVFHLVVPWIIFGVVAVLIAWGFHVAVDRKVEAERREAVEKTQGMLKGMRLHGLAEDTLRQFVCKYAGERWEEFYEAMFGYEAKLVARERWGRGEQGRLRKTYGAWRDPVVRWIEAKQQARREARERRLLEKIEEKNLEARGVNLLTARRQAKRSAEAMVAMAAELKQAARLPAAVRAPRPAIGKALREVAAKPENFLVERESGLIGPRPDGPLDLLLGPRLRFLAGAALLTGCLVWMDQNRLLTREKLEQARTIAVEVGSKAKAVASEAVKAKDVAVLQKRTGEINVELPTGTRPLRLPMLPKRISSLFNSFGPGVAGLILLASSFFRGARMSLFAFPAAAIAVLGPSYVPSLTPWASIGLGLLVGVVGFLFGRKPS